jgi:hypothetical protein
MFKLLLNLWEFCESVMPQCVNRWLYHLFSWFGLLVQRESSVVPSYHNPKIPLQPSAVDSASAPKEPEQIREEIGATGAKWCQPWTIFLQKIGHLSAWDFFKKWVFIHLPLGTVYNAVCWLEDSRKAAQQPTLNSWQWTQKNLIKLGCWTRSELFFVP